MPAVFDAALNAGAKHAGPFIKTVTESLPTTETLRAHLNSASDSIANAVVEHAATYNAGHRSLRGGGGGGRASGGGSRRTGGGGTGGFIFIDTNNDGGGGHLTKGEKIGIGAGVGAAVTLIAICCIGACLYNRSKSRAAVAQHPQAHQHSPAQPYPFPREPHQSNIQLPVWQR